MTDDQLKAFQLVISQHRDELQNLIDSDSEKSRVHLHGTGMDDVLNTINELKDILEKIKKKTFGRCIICNDGADVELERLECDYSTSICLSHYSDEQLRNLERDLELTAKVQKDLLPCCAPDTKKINFAHFSRPAGIVSGDYYDFFEMADGKQGIVIADVMGKGLSASMLMATLQATLRALGPEFTNVADLTTRLNKLFCYNLNIIRFISLCIICVDTKSQIIEYTNAGNPPPLFWDNMKNEIFRLNPTGPAIGLIKNSVYKSEKLIINPDNLLLMYTDGLIEARDDKGDEFGEERLTQFLTGNQALSAQKFLEKLQVTISSFIKKYVDDITMVAVKFL